MKSFAHKMALAGLFALVAGTATAGVTVSYVEPDKFTDIPFPVPDRQDTLKDLSDHFMKLGRALPPGQDLRIEVLDIDLAGRAIPSARAGRDIRVMRGGADWPRMQLRYTLESNGQVLKSGEAQLSDMDYMNRLSPRFDSDPLRYEYRMIDEWFDKNIAPIPGGARH